MKYSLLRLSFVFFIVIFACSVDAQSVFAFPPTSVTLSNSSLSRGQTATVTFTFSYAPLSFTTADITAPNGSISNLAVTGNPLVYTATYTPTTDTVDSTNTITVRGLVAGTTYGGLASGASGVVYDGANMWVSGAYGSSVSKVTSTGATTTYSGTGNSPYSIAFDGTNTWTANYTGSSVSKISPSGTITTYGGLGTNPAGIAFDGTNMWVPNYSNDSVSKVSPSGTVTTYTGTGWGPFWIAFDNTNMWTVNLNGSSVSKVTPSGTITTYSLGATVNPRQIAFDGTNMWTANSGYDSVSKITPSGTVTTYSGLAGYPYTIAFDNTNMWTGNNNGTVSKIAADGTITNYYSVPILPRGMAFDGTYMWVSSINDSSLTKIIPMDAVSSANFTINSTGGRRDTAVTAPVAPVLALSNITGSSVAISGNTGSPNGITSAGFDYGTDESDLTQTRTFAGSGQIWLSDTVTGLSCDTTYTVRSFVVNAIATTRGDTVTFKTAACERTQSGSVQASTAPASRGRSAVATTAASTSVPTQTLKSLVFTRNLHRGMSGADVTTLQSYLNTHGFTIAASGPGAPGSESNYFGSATHAALIRFQIAKGIVPAIGFFGPLTQKAVASTP